MLTLPNPHAEQRDKLRADDARSPAERLIDAITERDIHLAYEHFQHYAEHPCSASALRSAFALIMPRLTERTLLDGGVEVMREQCAKLLQDAIARGYPTPESNADQCVHGRFGSDDCIGCYDEKLTETVARMRSLALIDQLEADGGAERPDLQAIFDRWVGLRLTTTHFDAFCGGYAQRMFDRLVALPAPATGEGDERCNCGLRKYAIGEHHEMCLFKPGGVSAEDQNDAYGAPSHAS